jgi:hypothetical protein
MSTGAPLNLTLEPTGTVGWGSAVNANFSGINTAIAALQAGGSSGPAGATGAAGAVGIIWAGPWGSGTPYVATDAVSFNGSSYLALAPSTGVQPDTHPSTWAVLALAGATGPTGLQGPVGPPGSGGGSTVTFPITVAEGGTGAGDPFNARVNLGAAASNVNGDITALTGIPGVVISADFMSFTSGSQTFSMSHAGFSVVGGITCGNLLASGAINTGVISSAVPNSEILIGASGGNAGWAHANNGLVISGTAPVVISGQLGISSATSGTASPGGGQALPSTTLGFLAWNVGGTRVGIPFFLIP